ncbi:MAG: hypothetical protein AAF184_13410 [Pseudomonadota bacterium]
MSTRPNSPPKRATVRLLAAALVVLATPLAQAATDAEVAAKVRDCAGIRKDKVRLRCFDAALREAAPTPAPASTATTTQATPPEPAPLPAEAPPSDDAFGKEEVERRESKGKKKPPEETPQIKAVVAAIAKRRDGLMTITLDNDQVWRQKSVTTLFRLRVGDEVTVKKGRFGGYTLVAPGRKSTAVTRLE